MRKNSLVSRMLLVAAATTGACTDAPEAEDLAEPAVSETSSELTLLASYSLGSGQSLKVVQQDPISYLTSRIASCGDGVIYSSRTDGTLWVNLTQGVGTWTQVTEGTKGTRIACDRFHLYSLTSGGTLYHAYTGTNGQLRKVEDNQPNFWQTTVGGASLSVPSGTDEIEGGMGNIYALAINSSGVSTLYSSQHWNPTAWSTTQGTSSSWTMLANNLGSSLATGAGSKATFVSWVHDGLTYKKRNRAFGANPDSTLYFNDSMLYGQNGWSNFPNAGLDIVSITADSSSVMYALATGTSGLGRRLVKFTFAETDCHDNLDNDASGEADAEDAGCRSKLATEWCSTHNAGKSYCIDRIEATNTYSHALVTCNGAGVQPTIEPGLCTWDTTGTDYLTPARANSEPFNSGHYCNVHNTDGTWAFSWTGSTPCATLLAQNPGATIVRAGIYSASGENSVAIKCSNGGVLQHGVGTAPLVTANNDVGHTANRCVVTVSPRYMRVFKSPIVTEAWGDPVYGARGYHTGHMADHHLTCVAGDANCPCTTTSCSLPLIGYGNGENFSATRVDTFGKYITNADYEGQNSYDYLINEGTPLKSLGYGTVVMSRDRDIVSSSGTGTSYQKEIYVRYDVGSDPTYQESFIAYYAHLQVRSVVTGQTVKPGQLIGYSGTSGSSTAPHLHFGLLRLSNTNGQRAGSPANGHAFGYHVPFQALTSAQSATGFNDAAYPGIVDPYGWRAPAGIDPQGHLWLKAQTGRDNVIGNGAWSPAVFTSSEEPPYPM